MLESHPTRATPQSRVVVANPGDPAVDVARRRHTCTSRTTERRMCSDCRVGAIVVSGAVAIGALCGCGASRRSASSADRSGVPSAVECSDDSSCARHPAGHRDVASRAAVNAFRRVVQVHPWTAGKRARERQRLQRPRRRSVSPYEPRPAIRERQRHRRRRWRCNHIWRSRHRRNRRSMLRGNRRRHGKPHGRAGECATGTSVTVRVQVLGRSSLENGQVTTGEPGTAEARVVLRHDTFPGDNPEETGNAFAFALLGCPRP